MEKVATRGFSMKSIKDLVSAFGGPVRLSKHLFTSSQNISMWSLRGYIPPEWGLELLCLAEKEGVKLDKYKLKKLTQRREIAKTNGKSTTISA